MPGSSRIPRCVWREAGQRCRRSASGKDGLCNPHRIAAQHVAEEPRPARPFGAGLGAVLDDFLSGRKISDDAMGAAIDDLSWMMGGGYGAHHEIFGDPTTPNPGFRPPHGQQMPPNWRPRSAPPPPPDPALEERRLARRILGFADGEPITAEAVSARRKELARKYHPDRAGGSLERMQAINSSADLLLETLG